MVYVGWALFVITLIWAIKRMKLSHRKRLNLDYYVAYLLLNDSIREKHKTNFLEWIRTAEAPDANVLAMRAYFALEQVADRLAVGSPERPAESSVLGAMAMIWECKKTGR